MVGKSKKGGGVSIFLLPLHKRFTSGNFIQNASKTAETQWTKGLVAFLVSYGPEGLSSLLSQ